MTTKYKTEYHAIEADSIRQFNKDLKEYAQAGYIVCYPMNVAIAQCMDERDEVVITRSYSTILQKTTEVKEKAE